MPTTPPRVLVVDDNEDTCFVLYNLLKAEGYDAVTALNVADALTLAGREEFDFYILDMRYPDGTGIELCRGLGELRRGAKVIFYSGAAYETDRRSGLEAGALAYVMKPEIDELLETVRRALGDTE